MPPLPEAAALERYIEEAARALGVPIAPEWRPAVAEHYRRLLEAEAAIQKTGLCDGEPAVCFEPMVRFEP